MPITKRITIERYKNPSEDGYAGLIEGETDAGRRWIMWLGQDGSPEVYWPDRHEDGAVRGKPTVIWNEFDRRDWGTSDHPMTYEEAHADTNTGESGSEESKLGDNSKQLQVGKYADDPRVRKFLEIMSSEDPLARMEAAVAAARRMTNEANGNFVAASQVTNYAEVIAKLAPKEGEEVISTFPVWSDGMRAILFGIVPPAPPESDERENLPWVRMLHLLTRLQKEFIEKTLPVEEGWSDSAADDAESSDGVSAAQ